jgi:integrase
MKLTERRIREFECPVGKKDVLLFDDEQKGLGVRATASGRKSFLAQYTFAGMKRRIPLGSCSAISLAGARNAAQAILGKVANGRDPAADRKQAAADAKRKAAHDALTLGALLEQWQSLRLAKKRKRYVSEALRAVRYAFAKHLNAPAADLDRTADVEPVLDALTKAGRTAMASRTAAYGCACYRWAIGKGKLTANPFQNLSDAPVTERKRVLTDAELLAIWQATAGPGPFNAIVRMLALTGQRRQEVAGMTWNEIAPDLSTWTLPENRTKNGATHIVPLSAQAQAIIKAAPRRERSGTDPELVFWGQRGPFNGFGKAKASLDIASGVKDWRLHDLRRTLASGLQELGVKLEVTEAVLNHKSGSRAGIVGVYQVYDYAPEKRAALAAWGERVAAIVEGREAASNVTPFRAA